MGRPVVLSRQGLDGMIMMMRGRGGDDRPMKTDIQRNYRAVMSLDRCPRVEDDARKTRPGYVAMAAVVGRPNTSGSSTVLYCLAQGGRKVVVDYLLAGGWILEF